MLDKATCSIAQQKQVETDLLLLAELKKEKGLVEIKDDRLKELAEKGIIAVVCPDGDHSIDIFGHLCQYSHRVHTAALNGGAMLMSPSNLRFGLEGRALTNSVSGAWQMEKGKTVLLLSHWPCGQARADDIRLAWVIKDTLDADNKLTHTLGVGSEVVLPLFHVDWTPFEKNVELKRRRTYVIKKRCYDLLLPHLV